MTDTGEMGRRLRHTGQLALAIVFFALAALGIPLAVDRLHQGNPIGGIFVLVNCGWLGWAGIRRLRILRGWTEPLRTKQVTGALFSLYLGTGMTFMTILAFAGHTFRERVGSVGADALGVLAAIGAVCLFLMSWMVWSGRQSLLTSRGR